MQSTLHLTSAASDAMSRPAPSSRRANAFAAAGAAMVTAGALAVSPIAPSLPAELSLPAIQKRAIELTALSATASPITVYSQVLTNTFTNLSALGQAVAADPLPILSQVLRNQLGYAERIGSAVAGIPAGWQTYSAGRGATFLTNFQTALAQGDTAAAVNYLSSYILYGLQATVTPIYNTILTYTPRGATEPILGIPQQMAQNFANAVGALFSTTSFISGIFQSGYGMALGTLAAAGEGIAGIAQAVEAGDPVGAVNAAVNLPGLVVNAFLNGWQHPQSAAPFPALLTFIPVAPPTDPANGVTRTGVSIGLLGRLLVTIPQSIAKAITPVTTAPASSAVAASSAATAEPTQTVESGASSPDATAESTTAETADTTTAASTAAVESAAPSRASLSRVTSIKAAKKAAGASASEDKAGTGSTSAGSDGTASSGARKAAGRGHSARSGASSSSSGSSASE